MKENRQDKKEEWNKGKINCDKETFNHKKRKGRKLRGVCCEGY